MRRSADSGETTLAWLARRGLYTPSLLKPAVFWSLFRRVYQLYRLFLPKELFRCPK
jgi:hypothetical protein